MSHTAYPLSWPLGRPRTPSHRRTYASFGTSGRSRYGTKEQLTVADARSRLQGELDRLGAREIILSTNCELRLDGQPRSDRSPPSDPGVALYFKLKGRDTVMACDKWNRVADNIAAVAKHIEALRGIERWGVGSLEQAFMGFQALPSPEQWWQVLGVGEHATPAEIDTAWRDKMRAAHPDTGGTNAAAARLNWARDQGKRDA